MRKALFLLLLSSGFLSAAQFYEQSTVDRIRFLELFSDPATRTQSLAGLIPGSDEAFFYTALNHQLNGRGKECQDTIREWKASQGDKLTQPAIAHIAILENRQLLLDYDKDPKASLAGLIRHYGLRFDDVRPDAEAEAKLPSKLDPALLTEQKFEDANLKVYPDQPYAQYADARFLQELDQAADFSEEKVRWFMDHLTRYDYPGVTKLVEKALSFEQYKSFDSIRFREQLTSQQLEELLKRVPRLMGSETFGVLYLRKLMPGSEVNFSRDIQAHAAHLQKCRDYVITLPPSLSYLKAHVLYQHLLLQRKLGNYPKDDFIRYLALPLPRNGLLDQKSRDELLETGNSFSAATGCEKTYYDEQTIIELLTHFLGESDSSGDFSSYIEEKKLEQLHAAARLLNGADTKRWGAKLGQETYQDLLKETRITPAPDAPQILGSDDTVTLPVELKNTPELLVRIYELDQPSYLAINGKEPAADIELEGLVPHFEKKLSFSQSPLLLHRESIFLPELKGPGVWAVELVSGNTSARALVHKGQLNHLVQAAGNGQWISAFDEKGSRVNAAIFEQGGETYQSGKDGRILVPDSTRITAMEGVLRAGKLASYFAIQPRAESLALDTRFFVDREQLLSDHQANLQVRIRLTNRGLEIPLDRLQHVSLVMKAELEGGVTTERVIAENLKLQSTFSIPFQIPADLNSISFTLTASVDQDGNEPLKLSGKANFKGLKQPGDSSLFGAFYSPTKEGHRLELRGRNGEPLALHYLTLACYRRGYAVPVKVPMRTDDHGRVALGSLEGITSVEPISSEYGNFSAYAPQQAQKIIPSKLVQVSAKDEVRLLLAQPDAKLDRKNYSLLELNDDVKTGESFVLRDHFDKLAIRDGALIISKLPPGLHKLTQAGYTTSIYVSSGDERDGLLISKIGVLPKMQPAQPSILSATITDSDLLVKIHNASEATRVTVLGRRFSNSADFSNLQLFTPLHPFGVTMGFTGCSYLTDRRISDELRYILDRRAQKTFAATMLSRPGLLINRWVQTDIQQRSHRGKAETAGKISSANESLGSLSADSGSGPTIGSSPNAFDCDFLAHPSVVRYDLKPDADGFIKLPAGDFSHSQFITVIVADAYATQQLDVPLPANDAALRDRRIAKPLDPTRDYHATRSAVPLKKNQEATIQNLLDSDWRSFTTIRDVQQWLYGITGDDRLREFSFLSDWPDLSEKKKQELLAKYACNELHLFLFRKDHAFFEKYVNPLLAQKLEPKFIDDYLLGRDLSRYLRPHAWRQLNAAEKALLAQALPDAKTRISRELFQRWQRESPTPEVQTQLFSQTLRGVDLATLGKITETAETDTSSLGSSNLLEKMRSIIVPRLDFEDTTVAEAINFLRQRAAELDVSETDPSRRGVNFVITAPSNLRVKELKLRNVPLNVALKYICDQTKFRFKVDDYAVTLVPQTETGEDIFTRSYSIAPDFAASLSGAGSDAAASEDEDPFAEKSKSRSSRSPKSIKELLTGAGVSFAEGSSASIRGGKLVVTNTPTELDKISNLTAQIGSSPSSPYERPMFQRHIESAPPAELQDAVTSGLISDDEAFNELKVDLLLAVDSAWEISTFPKTTKLWNESNYYHYSGLADELLIPLNAFWLDLATWDGKEAFISPHFNECISNANEALFCLAMLDLAFKAEQPQVTVDGSMLRVKATDPMLLFYKDIRPTGKTAEDSPLLVRQSYMSGNQALISTENGTEENTVTGEFLTGLPYQASFVVTNPTGIQHRIDVLAQIPAGAIPLAQQPATLSSTHQLEPHGVLHLNLSFYFPAPGDFKAYPLHVSQGDTILAEAESKTLHVVASRPTPDARSWPEIASQGTDEQVLEFLRTADLGEEKPDDLPPVVNEAESPSIYKVDLQLIRWRLSDAAFFQAVSKLLRERMFYSPQVTSYGFVHNDREAIRDLIENSYTPAGPWLRSPLLNINPCDYQLWETLDFDPLINVRAHAFGNEPRITHKALLDYYQQFLDLVAWKPALEPVDELQFTALLLLQDRVEEAISRFSKIDASALPGRITYDYLHAVILFHQEKPTEARSIAAAALTTLPTGLWKDRFQAVINQADEITHLSANGVPREDTAGTASFLDLSLASEGKLHLRHHGMKQASLRLYSVDLEALFSREPFALATSGNIPLPAILPNETKEVKFEPDTQETVIDLPERLLGGSLLVSAQSGSTKLLKVLDSSLITARIQQTDRTIQVIDSETQRPLPKTYVKVYVENAQGVVAFYKDGYTDLRGKFDYLSRTSQDGASIKRLAILVSHPDKGTRTLIDEHSGNSP